MPLWKQGLPNMGAGGAGAGNLDFLRDSQQVIYLPLSIYMFACACVCIKVLLPNPNVVWSPCSFGYNSSIFVTAYASRVGETKS